MRGIRTTGRSTADEKGGTKGTIRSRCRSIRTDGAAVTSDATTYAFGSHGDCRPYVTSVLVTSGDPFFIQKLPFVGE
ncbi:hypothetical protein JTE90_007081 [Oedothorax gibbosus]|uniref:Uncharacterized protein n=1 Tax=Oedothorax gibbosus TaxID=931172 RepID=A0AAV6VRT2_9ARAC|nr:hypothetical protein JTE90_007081 [Oedothorax gibbosus]